MRFAAQTALAVLLLSGCASEQFIVDAAHPEIAVDESGRVAYRGESVNPDDLPDLLRESGLTRSDTIFIHIPHGLKDYRTAYYVMGTLARNGFSRPILVEDRKATSEVSKPRDNRRQRSVHNR